MRKALYIALCVSICVVAVILTRLEHPGTPVSTTAKKSNSSQTSHAATPTTNAVAGTVSPKTTTTPSSSHTGTTTNKPAVATPAGSNCDAVFSQAEAQAALGTGANPAGNNGVTSQDGDGSITTCSYTSGSQTAKVVAHLAKSTAGQSANELEFGSERPSNTTTVSGYGNAAFWEADNSTLNVLSHNNWYEISNGSLNGAKTVANAIQLGS